MPKNRSRRKEANGDLEESGTEESYVNGSVGHNSGNRAGAEGFGEFGNDNDNEHINNNSGGRPRQNRGGDLSQPRVKNSFGQYTEAVSKTVRSMGTTHQAIKDLHDLFKLHLDDISMMEETQKCLNQLKEKCKEMEEEIRSRDTAIDVLTRKNQKVEEENAREKKEIEEGKKQLKQDNEKLEKRVEAKTAEEKLRLRSEFDKHFSKERESIEARRTELENEIAKQKEANERRATDLEASYKQLSTTVDQQKKTIEAQKVELYKSHEQCDVLERAKNSFKFDKLAVEKELENMKTEFALSPKSKEHFKRGFKEISQMIDEISWKYFGDINRDDMENVHKEMAAADPCFASVPIGDTDDSNNLRVAHAQRIISDAICEYIWKPFRSDFTLSHPDFNYLLATIAVELEKSGQGGRAANAWTALTMRALQSLPADPSPSRASQSKESLRPVASRRAEAVFSKVSSILKPLVSPSEYENFHIELLKLAEPAIDIWNDAHTGGLKIIVSPKLEPARREEWRSETFDPPGDNDNTQSDITSETHPRIFTLFPQVTAWEVVIPVKHDSGPPGSWPPESDQGPRTIETCIHPGIGLRELSPLVVRGKTEQEETDKFMSEALEKARKEIQSNKRFTGHARRESTGSSISSPSSPSQQWKTAGFIKAPEK